ncbi:MAG: exonuclease subunit SbcD [Gammaproteobacteria bacterium]|nr:exonuclease subunit SbcD [Gammaproteobacteria bacterium]
MKILHTSDWHLGRSLYGRKRDEEFDSFLSWLTETIQQEQVDVLLVAGDIFDTTTPTNRAQALYYQFLCRVAASSCRHVIVIAGNHDSPSFLNAPKELLRVLNVHVIGSSTENCKDEVLLLQRQDGSPELIVCAVPYLRDRDLRVAEAGESIDDKERKLLEGIRAHYTEVGVLAEQKRKSLSIDIPIIAMGHLFTAGGQTVDGDGTRPLYVGSLAQVTSTIFPECIDYLALGHLHGHQKVNDSEVMRYSGSPLPMGFGEAKQKKSVCLITFSGRKASVVQIKIPTFQRLARIQGNWDEIFAQILELSATQEKIWLEVIYDGEEIMTDLRKRLEEAVSETEMELLRVRNNQIIDRVLNRIHDETLDDLNVNDVFERCLDQHEIVDKQRPKLLRAYQEIVMSLHEKKTQEK